MKKDTDIFQELLSLEAALASAQIIDEKSLEEDAEEPVFDEYYEGEVFEHYSNLFDAELEVSEKQDASFEECCDETEIKDGEIEQKVLPCWEGYVQLGMKKGKNGKMVPNCVPVEKKSALKDPDGGLTAAGRKFFNRTQGANLKPGVKGAADTPEKMRRKGSFLTRFFTNPSGPMVDEKGRATRLALSASAWGERVPKNNEDAAALAEKGRKLLDGYENTKKKDDLEGIEEKAGLGPSIGAASGTPGSESNDGIDHDGDGMIFDGTDKETRAPYKRQSNSGYEKNRRSYVRQQLTRQGVSMNANVQDRSQKERNARARARAAFDTQTRATGARAQADIGRATTDASRSRRNEAAAGRLQQQANRSSAVDRKPADRYQEPARLVRPGDGVQKTPKPSPKSPSATRPGADRSEPRTSPSATRPGADRSEPKPSDRKPADRYPEPARPVRPGDGVQNRQKPSPKSPSATRPGADRSEPRTSPSATRPGADRSEPKPSDRKPADRYPEAPRGVRPGDGIQNRTKPGAKTPSSSSMGADRTDGQAAQRSRTENTTGGDQPVRVGMKPRRTNPSSSDRTSRVQAQEQNSFADKQPGRYKAEADYDYNRRHTLPVLRQPKDESRKQRQSRIDAGNPVRKITIGKPNSRSTERNIEKFNRPQGEYRARPA